MNFSSELAAKLRLRNPNSGSEEAATSSTPTSPLSSDPTSPISPSFATSDSPSGEASLDLDAKPQTRQTLDNVAARHRLQLSRARVRKGTPTSAAPPESVMTSGPPPTQVELEKENEVVETPVAMRTGRMSMLPGPGLPGLNSALQERFKRSSLSAIPSSNEGKGDKMRPVRPPKPLSLETELNRLSPGHPDVKKMPTPRPPLPTTSTSLQQPLQAKPPISPKPRHKLLDNSGELQPQLFPKGESDIKKTLAGLSPTTTQSCKKPKADLSTGNDVTNGKEDTAPSKEAESLSTKSKSSTLPLRLNITSEESCASESLQKGQSKPELRWSMPDCPSPLHAGDVEEKEVPCIDTDGSTRITSMEFCHSDSSQEK